MSGNNMKYEIADIEYCPQACGQPHIVTVRKRFGHNGEEREKESVCYLFLNHNYEDGRFIPKAGPEYYQEHNFATPVKSFIASNGIGEFVAAEFKRRFQKQREEEGW